MHLGFASMNTMADVPPHVLGRELEDRGFESVWFGEHSHIPASRLSPYPAGGDLPARYWQMMDPFVALAVVAATTKRLRLGTGVSLVLEHHVLGLAKTVSTLDCLSEGRLLFAAGVGWNREELANHRQIAWSDRYAALVECIAALRVVWTEREPQFHGKYFAFDRMWAEPKPVQKPYPPVLFGTAGPIGMALTAEHADGWFPVNTALRNVGQSIRRFRELVEENGRDPETVPVTLMTFGDPDMAQLELFRDLGVIRVVVGAARRGWDDPRTTMPCLDYYGAMLPNL